jgi:hypothetical protein
MFRIEKSQIAGSPLFMLSGRIQQEQVQDLQSLLESEGEDTRIAFDLKELRLVDREAVRFFALCTAKGIRLENCPAYIREWVEKRQGL